MLFCSGSGRYPRYTGFPLSKLARIHRHPPLGHIALIQRKIAAKLLDQALNNKKSVCETCARIGPRVGSFFQGGLTCS